MHLLLAEIIHALSLRNIMYKQKTVAITGASGFIGSYLLKLMLQNGHKVYALARAKDNKNARDRVMELLKFWDDGIDRQFCNLEVWEGDVTEKYLGLNAKSRNLLRDEIVELYHCAAVTQFSWPLEDIRKVNVAGTKNVLDLAFEFKAVGKLKKVNHLSTAYVCGDHEGVFREEDLDVGQGFKTAYEQSKFEAEKMIEGYRAKGLWVDIFRPPVVSAESSTGKIFAFQAPHQMFHMWFLELFDVFPGREISMHIIPVDVLSDCILSITECSNHANRTYHPFGSESVSLTEMLNTASEFLKFKKPELITFKELGNYNLSYSQKKLIESNISFLDRKAVLDSRRTVQVLENCNFIFPRMSREIFNKTFQFFQCKVAKKNGTYPEE